jgi:peptidoglycan/xylan/chitin deacetylase (PgdA/CDA1 family)
MKMKYRHILIVGLVLGLAVVAFGSNHPYISNPGTLLDGFEDVNDWTVSGTGATAANDTSIFKFGNQSIKVNATNGNETDLRKSGLSLDLSSADNFSFWVYVHDDPNKLHTFYHCITSTTNWSKCFYHYCYGPSFAKGWNYIVWPKSLYTNAGGDSWSNTMVKMAFEVTPFTGQSVSASFDDLRTDAEGKAKVIIAFDDGSDGQINKAYPIMAGNGQRGAAFVISSSIGISERMTLANLTTLRDAGWDISNHTATHKNLTLVSQEEMEADIDGGYDWLVANGFINTAKFFAYPYGGYNDAVVAKVKERHVLARGPGGITYAHFWIQNYYDLQFKLNCYGVTNTTSVATVEAQINGAIESGGLLILVFHQIVDSDATAGQYLTADFQIISNYLKTKQDAGLLEVITFSDYYNALIEWPRLEPFCLEKPAMDFNGDCKVDFKDLALFAQSWLECNLEPKSACWE